MEVTTDGHGVPSSFEDLPLEIRLRIFRLNTKRAFIQKIRRFDELYGALDHPDEPASADNPDYICLDVTDSARSEWFCRRPEDGPCVWVILVWTQDNGERRLWDEGQSFDKARQLTEDEEHTFFSM
jgi:hypothetical protein